MAQVSSSEQNIGTPNQTDKCGQMQAPLYSVGKNTDLTLTLSSMNFLLQ